MSDYKKEILRVLTFVGGLMTRDVADRVTFQFGHNRRTHSAFVRTQLIALQDEGLVTLLDNSKPDVWVRKPKTTSQGEQSHD